MEHSYNYKILKTFIIIVVLQFQFLEVHPQQFEWGRTFRPRSTPFPSATGNSIVVGENDDVFVSGYYSGQLNVDGIILNSVNSDGFLIKLDSTGKTLWAHRMGASDAGIFSSVKTDRNGDVYACGTFNGSLHFQSNTIVGSDIGNGILIKYAKDGSLAWMKTHPLRPLQRIVIDKEDNIYALGYEYNFSTDGILEGIDVWLMKYDHTGKQLYNQLIFRDTNTTFFWGRNLTVDPWKNIFISGLAGNNTLIGDISYTGSATTSFVLVKCNNEGVPQWVKGVEDVPHGGVTPGEIISDGLGNVYYSTFAYKLSLYKFDPSGNNIWTIKRDDVGLSISKLSIDAYGNLLATGEAHGEFTYGKVRFSGWGMSSFIALFDNEGEIQWKLQGSNEQNNYMSSLDRSSTTGNIYVTGILQSQSPSFGNISLPDHSSAGRAVVLKVSETGFKPLKLNLGNDTSLCAGESIELRINGFASQEWQNGSRNSTFLVDKPGEYHVAAVDFSGKQYTDTLRVEACVKISVPNIITPNGDGYNDYFVIGALNTHLDNKLTIYNRWGKSVYLNLSYKNDWNAGGLSTGVYYYELHESSTGKIYTGWVQVLR